MRTPLILFKLGGFPGGFLAISGRNVKLLFFVTHIAYIVTHLCRMEFPTVINWTSPFPFSRVVEWIFVFILIQMLIEQYVTKQWRP